MKRSLIALAVVAGLFGAGCGQPELREGSVTKLVFIPAHDETTQVPIYVTTCSSSGSTVVCTQNLVGFIPVTDHKPDSYQATIFACDAESKCRKNTLEVDAATFGTLKIGTWFNADSPDLPRNI